METGKKFKGIIIYAPGLPGGVGGDSIYAPSLEGLRMAADLQIGIRVKRGWTGSAEIKVYCNGTRCELFDFSWIGFGPVVEKPTIKPAKEV